MRRIKGTQNNDTLVGSDREDRIEGLGGDDRIDGGGGADLIMGGDGGDRLDGEGGRDYLYGEAGDDLLFGGSEDGIIDGGSGNDLAVLDFSDLTEGFAYNAGRDGTIGSTLIRGIETVILTSGSGHDRIEGGAGDDFLNGGAGHDMVIGGYGRDTLVGGLGNDILHGGETDLAIIGGEGTDWAELSYLSQTADLRFIVAENLAGPVDLAGTQVSGIERMWFVGGSGNDTVVGGDLQDSIFGNGGNDLLAGGAGDDRLEGGDGNDVLIASNGDDIVRGGSGTDTAIHGGLRSDYKVELAGDGQIRIIDQRPGFDGTDLVDGIELFHFSDGTYSLDELVNGRNHAPTARDDQAAVGEDASIIFDPRVNDSDPDSGDQLTLLSIDTAKTRGTAVLTSDGQIAYTPGAAFQHLQAGEAALDTVTYTVRDKAGLTSTATVTFSVIGASEAPTATADAASVSEDGKVVLNVLFNDLDPEAGETLTLVSVTPSGRIASLESSPTGEVGFTPGAAFQYLAAGQSVVETATYVMRDASGLTSSATISFTVVGANDAPVATNDQTSVDEDSKLMNFSILGNDSDVDQGAVLSLGGIGLGGTRGQVTQNPDGTINYDPGAAFQYLKAGEVATDSFSYSVRDGAGGQSNGVVTITIVGRDESGLTAVDDSLTFGSLAGAVTINSLLANDVGDGLTITGVSRSSARGFDVIIQPDGTLIYDPYTSFFLLAPGETMTDSFSYTVRDSSGATATATATLTITGEAGTLQAQPVLENESTGDIYEQLMETYYESTGVAGRIVAVDSAHTIGQVSFDAAAQDLSYTADHPWLELLDPGTYTPWTSFRITVEAPDGSRSEHVVQLTIGGTPEDQAAPAPSHWDPGLEAALAIEPAPLTLDMTLGNYMWA